MKFGIVGVGGYVAPKHLKAIKETGNKLIAACDVNDSVGILDSYFPECEFFTRHGPFFDYLEENKANYLSVCSPNNFHYLHCSMALERNINVICEKPLVVNNEHLALLKEAEKKSKKEVNVILQLRVCPEVIDIKNRMLNGKHEVEIRYITPRGPWYLQSWKGDKRQSGGLMMNIGIHFFDLLLWLFGDVKYFKTDMNKELKTSGYLELERAKVKWFLSIDRKDLPNVDVPYRLFKIDGENYRFDNSFANLHTESYREILSHRGFGIKDAEKAIELVEKLH
jgi:UDP-N-acetyl-2-amino-2-deoxyglucuronate dehydrogenase